MMADEILKGMEYDSLKLVFNRFQSVVSFEATVATVLSPEVRSDWNRGLVASKQSCRVFLRQST